MNTLKQKAQELASYGRNGDTMLAHITPEEAALLKARGGSGTINPDTGLPEFFIDAVIGAVAGPLIGGLLGGDSAESAAQTQADSQLAAARIAAEESRFRPVAITTGFGRSAFETGEDGRVSGASYQLTPELQRLRDQIIAQATQQGAGLTTQGLGAAQGLFGLGQGLLPTSAQYGVSPEAQQYVDFVRRQAAMAAPQGFAAQATPEVQAYADQLRNLSQQLTPQSFDTQAAAQRFFQQQQDILRPEREQAMGGLMNRLAQTGTQGLGVAQAGGGMANPLAQAFANAQAQQDRVLAAQAEQLARRNMMEDLEAGTRLAGTGVGALTQSQQQSLQNALRLGEFASGQAGLGLTAEQQALDFDRRRVLGDIQAAQGLFTGGLQLSSGAYAPLLQQLQAAQGIEGMGQQALELGSALGGRVANPTGAQALMQGGMAAANTLGAVQGYNPLASTLMGLGQNQQFTNALAGMFSRPTVAPGQNYSLGLPATSANASMQSWFGGAQ